MADELRHAPMREDFIRGSDMVSLMQGKWEELWKIKMGLLGRKDLRHEFNVRLGSFTETFNIIWLEEYYEYSFIPQQAYTKMYGSIKLQGTLDGVDQDKNFGLECKHTHSRNDMDYMLDFYMPQMQFYMYISGLPKMVFSVIFGNKHECVVVSENKDYQNDMLDKIKAFWEYVTHNERPEDMLIKTKQSIKDNVAINGKVKRDVSRSNSFTLACTEYLLYEENAKAFDNAKKELKAEIKDNESEIYNDKLSVKRDKRGSIRITKKG
tara:strand:+ start:221 stop:1018 length:798 start_codon:yes stop_codon:yes gene_type:complete